MARGMGAEPSHPFNRAFDLQLWHFALLGQSVRDHDGVGPVKKVEDAIMHTRERRPQLVDSVPEQIGNRPPQFVSFRLEPREIRQTLGGTLHFSVRQFANICQFGAVRFIWVWRLGALGRAAGRLWRRGPARLRAVTPAGGFCRRDRRHGRCGGQLHGLRITAVREKIRTEGRRSWGGLGGALAFEELAGPVSRKSSTRNVFSTTLVIRVR